MSAHVLVLLEGLPYPFDVRVRAQVEALTQAGYEVTVVGPTGYGHDALEERLADVRILRYRLPPGGRGPVGYLREYAAAALALARVVRRVQHERPVDLVLVCNPPDLIVALTRPLARRGARVLFDYREICPELFEAKFGRRGTLHRLLLLAERVAFRRCDAVITVSEPCAQIARGRGRIDPGRLFLVGNGPDPRRVYPVAPRPELRRGRPFLVLWLGAMSRQEGLDRLIEAAEHLVGKSGRTDISFSLVGPGDAHESLREEVRRRQLSDFVEVRDAVDDDLVRALLSTADVCVNVDERNSMNDRAAMRKVLEYMSMGRAVVQFPLTEMQRLCGDAAVYARNADAQDLARQIALLIDDEPRRLELGERARRRVEDGLLWPQQVPSLLAAVSTALEQQAPERAMSSAASVGAAS